MSGKQFKPLASMYPGVTFTNPLFPNLIMKRYQGKNIVVASKGTTSKTQSKNTKKSKES